MEVDLKSLSLDNVNSGAPSVGSRTPLCRNRHHGDIRDRCKPWDPCCQ